MMDKLVSYVVNGFVYGVYFGIPLVVLILILMGR